MKREATRSLGDVIADYVQESHLEEGLLQTRIFAAWDQMTVGQITLGDCTSHYSFRNGILTCRIRSSVIRTHLQFQVEMLRARLNASLGEEYVKQVKLT
ncbi:MAG: DUF721 domain-containing protein [Bacteroidales bacterium]|nr:DUF721 domain-containing protein [Bacteroidales bacterium]